MSELFGTDGIRGRSGQAPLDDDGLRRIAKVIDSDLPPGAAIVFGRDTRESGPSMIKSLVTSMVDRPLYDLGIVTTPMVACETVRRNAALGVMVTASHNPAPDNGLKFFGADGFKIERERARRWSSAFYTTTADLQAGAASLVACKPSHYSDMVMGHFGNDKLSSIKVVFDLAHGAATGRMPALCQQLGLNASFVADEIDGKRINQHVGALHPQRLAARVKSLNAHIGFAFDGDGDRLVVIDHQGNTVPGDVVLFALAECLRREGHDVKRVYGTILAGQGLHDALAKKGAELIRTPVGDQYLLEGLRKSGDILGGEPSGHYIQMDLLNAGDGFLPALRLLRHLTSDAKLIQEASQQVPRYPCLERNIRISKREPIEGIGPLNDIKGTIDRELEDQGRLVLRYSGTEPLLRLFIEAKSLEKVAPLVDTFAAKAEELLNG